MKKKVLYILIISKYEHPGQRNNNPTHTLPHTLTMQFVQSQKKIFHKRKGYF